MTDRQSFTQNAPNHETGSTVRIPFMVVIYLTSTIANLSVGFALAGYNAVGLITAAQKPWEPIYTVLVTSSGILGLALGSVLTDSLLKVFGSRFRLAIAANLLIMLSSVPMMWLFVGTHALGRLMLGFGGGMFTVICSVFMAETVPAKQLSVYGTSINFGIVTGMLLTTLIQGFTLPDVDSDAALSTLNWRYGFLAPAIFAGVDLLMWVLLIRSDSLLHLVETKEEQQGLALFKRIYEYPTEMDLESAWFLLKSQRAAFRQLKVADKPSLWTIFSERKYQSATVFLVVAAFVNQLTGINAINIYSSHILQSIPAIPSELGVYMLSLANVVGALLGPAVAKCLSIRKLIIMGQFLMAGFLGAIVLFNSIDMPILVLLGMIGMILTFQMTSGGFYFVYVSQVCTETQNAFAVSVFWTCVLAMSLSTNSIIEGIGINGTFGLFAIASLLGGFFYIWQMRETEGFSTSACKQLFYPIEFQKDSDSFVCSPGDSRRSQSPGFENKYRLQHMTEESTQNSNKLQFSQTSSPTDPNQYLL